MIVCPSCQTVTAEISNFCPECSYEFRSNIYQREAPQFVILFIGMTRSI